MTHHRDRHASLAYGLTVAWGARAHVGASDPRVIDAGVQLPLH